MGRHTICLHVLSSRRLHYWAKDPVLEQRYTCKALRREVWFMLTCVRVEGGLRPAQGVHVLACLCIHQGVLGSRAGGVHTGPASPPGSLLEELQKP